MKNLFFVAVAIGIVSGTSTSVTAQTSVNLESVAAKTSLKSSPHFIESIEITPEKISDNLPADELTERRESTAEVVSVNRNSTSGSNIEDCTKMQFKYATVMNTEVENISNTALYNFIDEWWATRYHYGGSDKNGIDCSAFTGKLVSNIYGVTLPRTAADQYKETQRVSMADLAEGDLVFFNTRGGVSHAGLYLGNGYFVHSSVNYGVTISSLTDGYYNKRFISGGRLSK